LLALTALPLFGPGATGMPVPGSIRARLTQLPGPDSRIEWSGDDSQPGLRSLPLAGLAQTPRAVVAADTEGTGEIRLVVADFAADRVLLLRPGADGLGLDSSYHVPPGPRALLATDLDGDGRDDLLVASTLAGVVTP